MDSLEAGRGEGRGRAVLIAGPTASGKSALALGLAETMRGASSAPLIVNADAMQVYAGLRVLTARPSQADEAHTPHRLYGHVDPSEAYSVAQWLADIAPLLEGEAPVIIVGGTGLYLSALTEGLSDMPEVPGEVRTYWRERALRDGAPVLGAELARRDPVMASRLRPSDSQRLARALEVLDGTGQSLSYWQGRRSSPLVGDDSPRIVLSPDRAWLHARIAQRLDAMMGEGAVEEAAALVARDLPADRPALKALGVGALAALARGELDRDQAIARTARDTRRLAKRQETWFRNQFASWPRGAPDREPIADLVERIMAPKPRS